MIKEALDEKYSYQIDEYGMVHLFRGEEDCQQYLTNPLLSAIFKIEALKKENESVSRNLEHITDWLREKDENISPKNRKKLDKLAKKIEKCSSELKAIVADHYKEY